MPKLGCLLLTVLTGLVLIGGRSESAGRVIAVVIAERGRVTVDRIHGPQTVALSTDSDLVLGDTVTTGADGEVALLFSDGSQIKLNANSKIVISNTAPSVNSETLFKAVIGVLWAHLRPGESVETPAANVVVRGTEVAISVAGDGSTQVTVLSGDVLFENARGTVDLSDDEQSTAAPDEPPTAPVVVDPSGLISWTADVVGMPVLFETPVTSRGDVLRAAGDARGALAAYDKVLSQNPTDIDAAIGSALTESSQNDFAAASSCLTPVASYPKAIAIAGLIDLETGKSGPARIQFTQALAADPGLYQAKCLLAMADLQDGSIPDAEVNAKSAVALSPNSAESLGVLSTVMFFKGDTRQAAGLSREAIAANPHSPFALLAAGRCAVVAGKFELAAEDYERTLSFAPNLWLVHEELGNVYEQLGNPLKAREEYRKAIDLSPSSADAYAGLGRTLAATGSYPDARAAFQQGASLAPTDNSVRYYYASFLVDRGDLNGALAQIDAVSGRGADFGLLYARLAEIELYRQNVFEAQQQALKAVKLLPQSAVAHYELGRVYYEEQRIYQAEQEFRIATVLDPKLSPARYALGLIEEKTESGLLDTLSSIFDTAYVGSPASSTSLYDQQTPGSNERIQAELAQPTAIRSATRSYGNGELDVVGGTNSYYDAAGSYLTDTGTENGIAGVDGSSEYDHGVRKNADNTTNQADFVAGRDAIGASAGYVAIGDYQQTDYGLDSGTVSEPYLVDNRIRTQLLRLSGGVNVKTGHYGTILAIVQGSDSEEGEPSVAPATAPHYYDAHYDTSLLDGEVRWDFVPAGQNSVTLGASYGDRRRLVDTYGAIGPSVITIDSHFTADPFSEYLRDVYRVDPRWSVTGQLQYAQEFPTVESAFVNSPPLFPLYNEGASKSVLLPYVLIGYQPDAVDTFRIRYRRFVAYQTDFELLEPTDDFLLSYVNLPQATEVNGLAIADGSSTELEYDRSMHDGSFLSLAAFRQDLSDAAVSQETVDTSGYYDSVHLDGVQASYQNLIGRYVSYLLFGEYIDAEDTSVPQQLGDIPHFEGLGTLQYLNRAGAYAQAAYYNQGSKIAGDMDNGTPLGAFGVLDLRVGRRYGLRSDVYAEVNNVLNKRYDVFGELQPGMEVRVGTSQRF